MSTDYDIACHEHKEKVSICSDGFSGPLMQSDKATAAFCITHRDCNLRMISEHDDSCDDYKEWMLSTWSEDLNYDK